MARIVNFLRSLRTLSRRGASLHLESAINQWDAVDQLRMAYADYKLNCDPSVTHQGWSPEQFVVGMNVSLSRGTMLSWSIEPEKGLLKIGEGSWIGEYANFRVGPGSKIVLGRKCLVAQFCTFVGANHATELGSPIMDQPHSRERLDVIIGDDVWCGAGSILLPGAHVGDGAIIAAGSVLNRVVPNGEIWGGVPARRIGFRS